MHTRPLALTLDLDDTLWPIWPVIERAEQALHEWLCRHHPETGQRWPIAAMRELRARVLAERPDLAHDPSALRRCALEIVFAEHGGESAVEAAYAVFFEARNRVDLYPDVPEALDRLSRAWPLAALTNGNADITRIGLHTHFVFSLSARDHGAAKPSPCIFHAACTRLGVMPEQVLHVGDDPDTDVCGALAAGLATAWINRDGKPWPYPDTPPTLECRSLAELADRLLPSVPALRTHA
ncbi:MAG TPA: HAD family hydrolase [Xanthomonadales bacterium]|nr:HAD family hydrolase [Xanthomonadales bacterium]